VASRWLLVLIFITTACGKTILTIPMEEIPNKEKPIKAKPARYGNKIV